MTRPGPITKPDIDAAVAAPSDKLDALGHKIDRLDHKIDAIGDRIDAALVKALAGGFGIACALFVLSAAIAVPLAEIGVIGDGGAAAIMFTAWAVTPAAFLLLLARPSPPR